MQFNFIEVILVLGIIQGLFLAFALNKIKDKNKSANSALALILIVSALMLFGRMIFVNYLTPVVFKWISLVDSIILLFGPLTYMYLQRVIIKSNTSYKLPFIHYIPAIIHFSTFFYLAIINQSDYNTMNKNGTLPVIFNIVEFSGLVSNFFYLTKNYLVLREYNRQEKNKLSYTQGFHKYLFMFLVAISISLFLWLFSYINSYYLNTNFLYVNYQTVWVTIPLFIYIIGYFSLRQPEFFRIQPAAGKSLAKRLSELEISKLKESLDRLLTNEQIYLKNDLTLSALSGKLDTSPNDISWLLNNEYKSSFYDYINKFRIKEFLKRIDLNEHANQTILAIALDVGFNSKSTFNKAFKVQMNMTPSVYIKNLKITP